MKAEKTLGYFGLGFELLKDDNASFFRIYFWTLVENI